MTGNPFTVALRTPQILDKLEKHAIWRRRAHEKARARKGSVVGTGVACVTKDFGSGADCSLGIVSLDPDGRVTIQADTAEMGNGVGTALANRVAAYLGAIADEVTVARVDGYEPLGLVTSGNSYTMKQAEQDAAANNPRWVPAISSPSSSSIGAHVGTHAAAEAARTIFRFGMWPAALALWGIGPNDPRRDTWDEAFWSDRHVIVSGLPPLPLEAIAAKAHARNGVTGAMVHAFSRWAWASANFTIDGVAWQAEIDALAVRRGKGAFSRLERTSVAFPPTDYNRIGSAFTTGCATLVRIEIERATGALRIAKAYTVLECGTVLVPEVVLGQAQGALAMGVGHTLLEQLPLYEDGPGNGNWNLGDYVIARGSDLPLHDFEVEVLPPSAPNEPPKGMAEVVMIPVVSALLNAIHDATGKRFAALPVTRDMLRRAAS
jgi:CO/xanthine dehydrogenase Mo-binding subunit